MNVSFKNIIVSSFILAIILIAGSACNTKQDNSARPEARSLYESDARILRNYIDSIYAAPDSARLLSLCREMDKKITEINCNHSPAADRSISEAENDTLIMLVNRYVTLRDSLLYRFAHPIEPADSAATDSLITDTPSQDL